MKSSFQARHFAFYIELLLLAPLLTSSQWPLTAKYPAKRFTDNEKFLPDSPLLDSLLHTAPLLRQVADNPNYELQVIYTQINRDKQNRPQFSPHYYHVNPRRYFNPASLVKLPVAALALEKLHALRVSPRAIIATGTAFRCQTPVPFATPADSDRWATPANYIKRMLLVR